MGIVKTLDREYLSTHPEGDEKAKLSFSGTVPLSIPVPANPDGTRASATLQVTAENYMDAFQALNALHEDEAEQFLWELFEQVITEEEAASISSPEEGAALLKNRTHEIVVPFRTFTMEMSIETTDSFGTKETSDVVFELTTPSLSVGVALAINMSSPRMLSQLMVELSPQTDDDEDETGNEVLVVS
jgi:hypothetical protein